MRENVGGADRVMRFVAGPAMIVAGYAFLGGRRGSAAGLATMAAGLLTIESGITRVCPVNRIAGIDTR